LANLGPARTRLRLGRAWRILRVARWHGQADRTIRIEQAYGRRTRAADARAHGVRVGLGRGRWRLDPRLGRRDADVAGAPFERRRFRFGRNREFRERLDDADPDRIARAFRFVR